MYCLALRVVRLYSRAIIQAQITPRRPASYLIVAEPPASAASAPLLSRHAPTHLYESEFLLSAESCLGNTSLPPLPSLPLPMTGVELPLRRSSSLSTGAYVSPSSPSSRKSVSP